MMMMMPSLVCTGFFSIALLMFSSLPTAAALMAMLIPMIQSVSGDLGGSSVQNQL